MSLSMEMLKNPIFKENDYFPIESEGLCKNFNRHSETKEEVLGDQVCQACWDNEIGKSPREKVHTKMLQAEFKVHRINNTITKRPPKNHNKYLELITQRDELVSKHEETIRDWVAINEKVRCFHCSATGDMKYKFLHVTVKNTIEYIIGNPSGYYLCNICREQEGL